VARTSTLANFGEFTHEKLSEKVSEGLQRSLKGRRNGTFRPIFAIACRPDTGSERYSDPFSDSFGRGVIGSSHSSGPGGGGCSGAIPSLAPPAVPRHSAPPTELRGSIGNGGSDTLRGDNGNDWLQSGTSGASVSRFDQDSLDGGAGNDRLDGSEGRDTMHGGEGNDYVQDYFGNDHMVAVDGEHDEIYCGPGEDTVEADAVDTIDLDSCATVNLH
jgi:RTX calcium-binding nonapeptide repeat (4 copies)